MNGGGRKRGGRGGKCCFRVDVVGEDWGADEVYAEKEGIVEVVGVIPEGNTTWNNLEYKGETSAWEIASPVCNKLGQAKHRYHLVP